MNNNDYKKFTPEQIAGLVKKHAGERNIASPEFTCPKEVLGKIQSVGEPEMDNPLTR